MSDQRELRLNEVAASVFQAMASRLLNISPADFGGAVVIVPKEGDPIEMLILDPRHDLAMFWANIMSKAQMALEELKEQEQMASGFGRR